MLEINTIHNMDCLEGLKQIDSNSVDIIITDPPYSSGTRQQTDRTPKKKGVKWSGAGLEWDSCFSNFQLEQFMRRILKELFRVLKDGGHLYIFTDWRQYPMFNYVTESSGFYCNNMIVWDKGIYALGSNYRSQHELIIFASKGVSRELNNYTTGNVIKNKRISNSIHQYHPTQKPTELIRKILNICARKGDLIFDPFMGGGATAIASKELGLNFVGFEISKKYTEIGLNRLKQSSIKNLLQHTGRKNKTEEKSVNGLTNYMEVSADSSQP